jgi:serine-aspartate repeat-containing protein C/D/E
LDAVRQSGEQSLAGVEIALWKQANDGGYRDTTHRATTDAAGMYVFSKSLGLSPGQYRVVESQPEGLYSVAAVPGTANGIEIGSVESLNALTDIDL